MTLIKYRQPALAAWPGFGRLNSLHDELDRLFDASLAEFGSDPTVFGGWSPAIEVHENKDSFVVSSELPGMKKSDISVTLNEGNLIISGERKTETNHEDAKVLRSERSYGRFQRVLSLPSSVEAGKVKADYKDGVLTITLPKAEEAKPRQIDVSVN